MKLLIIILSFLLFSFPLLGNEKTCFVRVNSSDDFNQTLLSDISISLISQYLIKIKSFPSTGLSDGDHCIYEVTATLDDKKTFVTLQGDNLNSFGDSTNVGTDGFQQAILRSLYRSQRDKRELICSDYPKILEECGGVVRKSEKKKVVVSKVFERQQPKSEVVRVDSGTNNDCSGMSECIVGECNWIPKHCKSKKSTTNTKKCFYPELGWVGDDGKPTGEWRNCDWDVNYTAIAVERGTIECGGYDNIVWTNSDLTEYRCK